MCIASFKSMTYAIKAQKILNNNYLSSEIVKLDSSFSKKGCSYGVKFDCVNLYTVENILNNNNINHSQIITSKD